MPALIIRQYIHERILYDYPANELTDDLPLLEQGLIDSIQIVNLTTFLQDSFKIAVKPQELTPENFGSIDAIAAMVERLRRNP